MKHTTELWGSLALLSARNDSSILERCIQSAVTTMWGIPLAGSRINLPILHRSSSFRSYAFFSHCLLILYHTFSALSSLYYIAFWFGGRERNRTPPNWWIPRVYHRSVFFLTTFRLMERPLSQTQSCRWEMRGSQVLSHSLLILYHYWQQMSRVY